MIKLLLAFLVSFAVSLVLMPLIIKVFKKKSATQTILGYVEEHKEKNGTLTMGGVLFVLTTLFVVFFFLDFDTTWIMCLAVSIAFGVLGLMDDYLKIKYKQNLGLRPYQKIVGQLGISIIFAIYIYLTLGGVIYIPFSTMSIDLKWGIIPVIVLVLLATTNSVNLTDGLDGLAGSVSFVYLIIFTIIASIFGGLLYNLGETGEILNNIANINIMSMVVLGAILGFLIFNVSKASIFMGDVGSLFLGGYIGTIGLALGLPLIIPILGFCFVFSAISVILQVFVFKLKHKRVFKMAPFHHHLQMSGLSETKVVTIYSSITLTLGLLCIIFYLM